jgi:hypothetical protein
MHQHAVIPSSSTKPTSPPPRPAPLDLPSIDGANFTYPASALAHSICDALPWLLQALDVIHLLTITHHLRVFLIVISCSRLDDDTSALAAAVSASCSSSDWTVHCRLVNTASVGDLVSCLRWLAITHHANVTAPPHPLHFPPLADPLQAAYGALVISSNNSREQSLLALRADLLYSQKL